MGKLKILMILLIGTFMIQSCSDDDESNSEADLIGVWTYNEVDVEFLVNGIDIVTYLVNEGSSQQEAALVKGIYEGFLTSAFANAFIEFKADNTYEVTQNDAVIASGPWVVNATVTEITIDGGTPDEAIYQIASLSTNSMVILVSETEMDDLNEDQIDEEVTINFTFNLSK